MMLVECTRRSFIIVICNVNQSSPYSDFETTYADIYHGRPLRLDFGWDTFDEETKLVKRGVELNQGRAAMMGILGLMVHEQLGGVLPVVGQM